MDDRGRLNHLGLGTSIYLAVLNVWTAIYSNHYGTIEKNMLGTIPLLFTNFCATALIAYRTWQVSICFTV